MATAQMATMSAREAEQVERANATEKTPVVFIHGLWLLPSLNAIGAVGYLLWGRRP